MGHSAFGPHVLQVHTPCLDAVFAFSLFMASFVREVCVFTLVKLVCFSSWRVPFVPYKVFIVIKHCLLFPPLKRRHATHFLILKSLVILQTNRKCKVEKLCCELLICNRRPQWPSWHLVTLFLLGQGLPRLSVSDCIHTGHRGREVWQCCQT